MYNNTITIKTQNTSRFFVLHFDDSLGPAVFGTAYITGVVLVHDPAREQRHAHTRSRTKEDAIKKKKKMEKKIVKRWWSE